MNKPWKATAVRKTLEEPILAVEGRHPAVHESWSLSSKKVERFAHLEASAETINSKYYSGIGRPAPLDADFQTL